MRAAAHDRALIEYNARQAHKFCRGRRHRGGRQIGATKSHPRAHAPASCV